MITLCMPLRSKWGIPKIVNTYAIFLGNARSAFVPSLSQVPDSCCINERLGCGKQAFEDDNNPSATIGYEVAKITLNMANCHSGFFFQRKNLCERMHDRSKGIPVQACDATLANLCPCLFGRWTRRTFAAFVCSLLCWPYQGRKKKFSFWQFCTLLILFCRGSVHWMGPAQLEDLPACPRKNRASSRTLGKLTLAMKRVSTGWSRRCGRKIHACTPALLN